MNLYYSTKCQHCNSLIRLIKENTSVSQNIRAICIDSAPYPSNIHSVPTIEMDDTLYVGKQAFDYIYHKSKTQQTPSKTESSGNDGTTRGITGTELGSGFTYIDNANTGFRFGNDLTSSTISNDLSMPKIIDTRNTSDDTSQRMSSLKAQRDTEISLPNKRV